MKSAEGFGREGGLIGNESLEWWWKRLGLAGYKEPNNFIFSSGASWKERFLLYNFIRLYMA
jgi:hypothetical protein